MNAVEITLVVLGAAISLSILILTIQFARLAEKLIKSINLVEDTVSSVNKVATGISNDYFGVRNNLRSTSVSAVATIGAMKLVKKISNLFINSTNNE